jgi:YesN/AraC family two-component response regulator
MNRLPKAMKHHFGQSANIQRTRKAKCYLPSGEKIELIAARLGYASIHYFSRNFKEYTGLTPTEFKQQEHWN